MNVFTIPLAPAQPQKFTIAMGGIRYGMTLRWNPVLETWVLNISNSAGTPLASGIAVVAGADLVNQLYYLGFSGALMAQKGDDPNLPPTLAGLGITDGIYYVPYGQDGEIPFVREI